MLALGQFLGIHQKIYHEVITLHSPDVTAVVAAFEFTALGAGFPAHRWQVLFPGSGWDGGQNEAEGEHQTDTRNSVGYHTLDHRSSRLLARKKGSKRAEMAVGGGLATCYHQA